MLNSRDISVLRSDVAANCRVFIELCKKEGLDVLVTQTKRDNEYQAYLYEQGYHIDIYVIGISANLLFDHCS